MLPRRSMLGAALGLVGAASAACLSTRSPAAATGATAPAFSLKSHLGTEVSLDALVAQGPAAIVFYRGFW